MFEDREAKRASAFSVDVDAADPLGRYIGGLVLRGPDAHRLGRHVEGQLTTGPARSDLCGLVVALDRRRSEPDLPTGPTAE